MREPESEGTVSGSTLVWQSLLLKGSFSEKPNMGWTTLRQRLLPTLRL